MVKSVAKELYGIQANQCLACSFIIIVNIFTSMQCISDSIIIYPNDLCIMRIKL